MNRRNFIAMTGTAATVAFAADSRTNFDGTPPKSAMAIASTSFMTYGKPSFKQPDDTLAFLEKCHKLGAAGIQSPLSSTDPAALKKLRSRAEQLGMYIEAMAPLPKGEDMTAFEAAIRAAKEAGALAVRVGSDGGRRYEKWSSLEDWNTFLKQSSAAAHKVSAFAEREKINIGLENHKDWTVEEMLSGMKQLANDYFGVTLDFGNNLALLDPPAAILELAQYAKITHVKDMAVEAYADGFLLSEVVLGEGMLDLKKIVATVREKQPKTRFTLEMITRDPLTVPCLTDKYWVTFPNRSGRYLARMMKLVQIAGAQQQPLPRYLQLDTAAQGRVEEDNVKICLHQAREQLGL